MDEQKKFVDFFNKIRLKNFQFEGGEYSIKLNRWITGRGNLSPSVISFGELIDTLNNLKIDIAVKFFYPFNVFEDGDLKDGLAGLIYEKDVYSFIATNLIATKQCPNFIAFLGLFYKINMNDVEQKLQINPDILRRYREILISKNLTTREKLDESGMIVVITQRPPNVISLFEWFRQFRNSDDFMKIYTPVLFQILYCLCALSIHKIMHNDLHTGNILISTLDKKVKLKYKVNDVGFEIKTRYIVYIFDWDRVYVDGHQLNPLNEGFLCEIVNMCNKWNPYYDLFTILCSLDFLGVEDAFNIHPTIVTKEMESDEKKELAVWEEIPPYLAVPLFISQNKLREFKTSMEENPQEYRVFKRDFLQNYLSEQSFAKIKDIQTGVFTLSYDFKKIYLYNTYKCRLNVEVDDELPLPFELILSLEIFNKYKKDDLQAVYSINSLGGNNNVPRQLSTEDFEIDEQSNIGESMQQERAEEEEEEDNGEEEEEDNGEEEEEEEEEEYDEVGEINLESNESLDPDLEPPPQRSSARRDPPFG